MKEFFCEREAEIATSEHCFNVAACLLGHLHARQAMSGDSLGRPSVPNHAQSESRYSK
jgi:hypothetical protein